MKNYALWIIVGIITVIICVLTGCSEEPKSAGFGSLTLSMKVADETPSGRKSNETTPSGILVTLENPVGEVVLDLFEIRLVQVGEGYISETFSLPSGQYNLTQLLVIDGSGEAIYATPTQGSAMEHLVTNPLPLFINIETGADIDLAVEVVTTSDIDPSDLGYAAFNLSVVNVRQLKIFSSIADALGTFPEGAELEVAAKNSDGLVEWTRVFPVSQGMSIVVPEKFRYTFSLSKQAHISHIQHFSLSQLNGIDELHFELIPENSTLIIERSLFDGAVKLYLPSDRTKLYMRADLPEDFELQAVIADRTVLHALSDIPLADARVYEIYDQPKLQRHSINIFGNLPFSVAPSIRGDVDLSLASCCATDFDRDVKVTSFVSFQNLSGEMSLDYFEWNFDEQAFRDHWCATDPAVCD